MAFGIPFGHECKVCGGWRHQGRNCAGQREPPLSIIPIPASESEPCGCYDHCEADDNNERRPAGCYKRQPENDPSDRPKTLHEERNNNVD